MQWQVKAPPSCFTQYTCLHVKDEQGRKEQRNIFTLKPGDRVWGGEDVRQTSNIRIPEKKGWATQFVCSWMEVVGIVKCTGQKTKVGWMVDAWDGGKSIITEDHPISAGDGLRELVEARHCPEYRQSGEATELCQIILKTTRGTPWVRIGHRRALAFGTTRDEASDTTKWPEYAWY